MELLIGAAGVLVSTLTYYAGQRRSDRRHAAMAAEQRHKIVREFLMMARPLVGELRGKMDHLERVRRGTGDLYSFFLNEGSILSVEQTAALRTVAQRGGQISQACADSWYGAMTSVARAQDEFDRLSNLAAVGDLPENLGDGEAYRRGLVEAERALLEAVRISREFCPADTIEQIDSLLR